MTQMQIEQLTQQEYTHYLAFGEPVLQDTFFSYDNHHDENESQEDRVWISTLGSTTHPVMTFGYYDVPCTSTAV